MMIKKLPEESHGCKHDWNHVMGTWPAADLWRCVKCERSELVAR